VLEYLFFHEGRNIGTGFIFVLKFNGRIIEGEDGKKEMMMEIDILKEWKDEIIIVLVEWMSRE
jgi:hypothetical protein